MIENGCCGAMTAREREGFVYILISAVTFGCLPTIIKLIYDVEPHMDPISVLFWRFGLATVLLFTAVAVMLRRDAQAFPPANGRTFLLMGMIFTPNALCAFLSLALLPASTYVLLFYTYPAIVALIAWLRGEPLSARAWGALVLTLFGVVLTLPGLAEGKLLEGNSLGMIFAIANATLYSFYLLINGHLLRARATSLRDTAWLGLGGALVCAVLIAARLGFNITAPEGVWWGALVKNQTLALPISAQGVGLLLAIAVVGMVLPLTTLNLGVARLGAARSAILGTVEPVASLVLSVLVLRETLAPLQIVGAVLILASVFLLQSAPPKPNTVVQEGA
jgi:drug/metabolite transporter (DMT)-like permease